MKCNYCGGELPAGTGNCPYCGAHCSENTAPQQSTQPQMDWQEKFKQPRMACMDFWILSSLLGIILAIWLYLTYDVIGDQDEVVSVCSIRHDFFPKCKFSIEEIRQD